MASIIDALSKGAQERLSQTAKDAKEHVMNQIDPRQSIYQLGLGVGPLIRQTVAEYRKQQGKPASETKKQQENVVDIKKTNAEASKSLQRVAAQMSIMNSTLKEIRKINIAQMQMQSRSMKQDYHYGNFGKASAFWTKDEGGRGSKSLLSYDEDKQKQEDKGGGIGSLLSGLLSNPLVAILGGSMVGGELWKKYKERTEKNLEKNSKETAKDMDTKFFEGVTSLYSKAFESMPKTTLALTGIAGLLAAPGIKTGYDVAKGTVNAARGLSEKLVTPWYNRQTQGVGGEGWKNTARWMFGMEEKLVDKTAPKPSPWGPPSARTEGISISNAAKNYANDPRQGVPWFKDSMNQEYAAKYGDKGLKSIQEAANAAKSGAPLSGIGAAGAEAAEAAKAAGVGSKMVGMLGKVGGVLGKIAGPLGVAGSVYSTYDNASKGNTVRASLDALSAISGTVALTAGATGIGIPAAIAAGTVSALAGLTSFAIGQFSDDAKPAEPKAQAQPQQTPAGSDTRAQAGAAGIPSNVMNDKPFMNEVNRLAAKYKINPTDLLAVMRAENDTFDPARKNNRSGATGLIQFTKGTANWLGTSTEALASMSRTEQMKYVEKYFDKVGLPQGANKDQIYTAVFKPAALKGGSDVLYRKGTREYAQNIELDKAGKGYISIGDLSRASGGNSSTALAQSTPNTSASTVDNTQLAGNTSQDQIEKLTGSQAAIKRMTDLAELLPTIMMTGKKPGSTNSTPAAPATAAATPQGNQASDRRTAMRGDPGSPEKGVMLGRLNGQLGSGTFGIYATT